MNVLLESPVNVMRFYVRGIVYRVACSDIVYMETQNRYVVVYTRERPIHVPYLKLCDCMEKGEGRFVRCHRSVLVNPLYIEDILIGRRRIILSGGRGELSIGRKYVKEVRGIFDVRRVSEYTGNDSR